MGLLFKPAAQGVQLLLFQRFSAVKGSQETQQVSMIVLVHQAAGFQLVIALLRHRGGVEIGPSPAFHRQDAFFHKTGQKGGNRLDLPALVGKQLQQLCGGDGRAGVPDDRMISISDSDRL